MSATGSEEGVAAEGAAWTLEVRLEVGRHEESLGEHFRKGEKENQSCSQNLRKTCEDSRSLGLSGRRASRTNALGGVNE